MSCNFYTINVVHDIAIKFPSRTSMTTKWLVTTFPSENKTEFWYGAVVFCDAMRFIRLQVAISMYL